MHHLSPTRIGIFTDENWSPKKFLVPDPTKHKWKNQTFESELPTHFLCLSLWPSAPAQYQMEPEAGMLASGWLSYSWSPEERHLLRTSPLHIDKAICSKLAFCFLINPSFFRNFKNIIFIFKNIWNFSKNLIYWKAKWGQNSWGTNSVVFTDISKPCRVIYFLEGKEKYSTQKLL